MNKNTTDFVHSPIENSEPGAHCRIFSSEEFLRAPLEATEITATGTPVCIQAGKAHIIIGTVHQTVHKRIAWSFVQRVQVKVISVFRRANGPLDVTWIE